MRELVAQYLSKSISRRGFVRKLVKTGITLAAAEPIAQSLTEVVSAQDARKVAPDGVKIFEGTGSESFAEQLIASGVRYVFGNSASGDTPFYEALVDRPQLTYILTPHEGPGAAMARGYIMASGAPAIVMQAAVVGLMNAMGQLYSAFKEQTPLVCYSYRSDTTTRSGRDGFEEVAYQDQIVAPLTKYCWTARRADMIPETIRRAFKAAWTPPFGPTYASWPTDYNREKVRTEVILHEKVDPRMRIRPNPGEVELAAKLLVDARMPLLIVGDELYKTKSAAKAVKLAELLGMPVTQIRQVSANFPEAHPLWVGEPLSGGISSLIFPKDPDVVISIGNKLQHSGAAPLIGHKTQFIDMRIDAASMGNVITTDVPLVADVSLGMDDLIAAIESVMTPSIRKKAQERALEVRTFSDRASELSSLYTRNPAWNDSPLLADRVTWEVAQFADKDAIVVDESTAMHSFDFNPLGGRELFYFYAGYLGSGVGMAAGIKLAQPHRQVIALVGDGAFIFGPTALWNMARLQLPVTVVVYNNHAYGGPHNRATSAYPEGRMVETGKFFHAYLGKPDMNMAKIANGFGVDAEVVESPDQLKQALAKARRAAAEGKPYLIDAQVRRAGAGWAEKPWVPQLDLAQQVRASQG